MPVPQHRLVKHTKTIVYGVILRLRRTNYLTPFNAMEIARECEKFDGGYYDTEEVADQLFLLQEDNPKLKYSNGSGLKHGWFLER